MSELLLYLKQNRKLWLYNGIIIEENDKRLNKMATVTFEYNKFDVVEYIKKLRNAGVKQEVAEIQGQELEHAIESVLAQTKQNITELATKGDVRESELRLQKEIKELELKINDNTSKAKLTIIIWMGIFFISNGVLAHFLK